MLVMFPVIVKEAAQSYEPHRIAEYLIELAHKFNSFYQSVPVLKAKESLRNFRLMLVRCAMQVIKNGLNLLGIDVIEKM